MFNTDSISQARSKIKSFARLSVSKYGVNCSWTFFIGLEKCRVFTVVVVRKEIPQQAGSCAITERNRLGLGFLKPLTEQIFACLGIPNPLFDSIGMYCAKQSKRTVLHGSNTIRKDYQVIQSEWKNATLLWMVFQESSPWTSVKFRPHLTPFLTPLTIATDESWWFIRTREMQKSAYLSVFFNLAWFLLIHGC